MKHAAMRTKVRSLMRRTYAIAITSMAGLWHATWLMGVASVALVAVGVGTYVTATRRVTTRTGVLPPALPAALQSALRRAETALPAIEHTRHRHGLRAVVARATALSLSTQPGVDAELDAELADAIDAATAAAGRLDALDRRLADLDRDASDDQARQWLHERDTWSARLLTLTATLEALQARVSRASAVRGSAEDAEALDDLRAQVEAFEEVQHA